MLPGKKYGVQDVAAIAKRRWWIAVAPAAVGAMLALLVSASLPDTYQSEMLIQIVPQRVPDRLVPNIVTEKTEDRMDSLEAQVKSRAQLEQLIREFGLYREAGREATTEDLVDRMRRAIVVELVRPFRGMPPDSFYVRFTYHEPAVAARVTTRLGSIFVDKNATERVNSADSISEFLASQLSESKARLEAHEQRMEQFRQKHAGRLPSQVEVNLTAIQNTQSQLQQLVESTARDRDRRLMLERLYNDAAAEPIVVPPAAASAGGQSDGTAVLAMPLKQQLEVARATVTRLEARLTAQHPDLRRARKSVEELQQQVAAASQQAAAGGPAVPARPAISVEETQRRERLRGWKAEIESLERQIAFKEDEERRLRGVVSDYQARLQSSPGLESEWVALTRDYDTLSMTYKSLLQKSEDSRVGADLERRNVGEQFRVVDPARVPVRPIGPIRLQINALGLGAGLVLGLLCIGVLELRDRTFRSEADILDVLALPVLAVVPLVQTEGDQVSVRRRRRVAVTVCGVAAISAMYVFWSLQLWKHIV